MVYGLGAGVLWALETVVLSIVLSLGIFVESKETIFLAPFVCAFLNDTISGICLFFFRRTKKEYRKNNVLITLKNKNGKMLILSGLFGGPLGMSAYLLSIKYIGPSYTAVISAIYPALGSIIAWIFLKDKLSKKQLIGVCMCVFGSVAMVGIPKGNTGSVGLFIFAFACALFWALEAVISSYAMKSGEISFEIALQIRQGTSFLCYVIIFLPLLHAWGFTFRILTHKSIVVLIITGLLEMGSYLFYYKAINLLGAAKAMSLNITYIVWSVIFSVLIFREALQIYELISITILLTGVLFVVKKVRKNRP